MKLYRATHNISDADTVPSYSCWTSEPATVVAYTDNPGFGGEEIVEIEIETEEEGEVLDLRGSDCRDLRPVAEFLGRDLWDLKSFGYDSVFAVLENDRTALREIEDAGYGWVRYYDDFPENGDTWKKI